MGDSDHQPSKKRAAVKELSRDNPGLDDEESSAELESGTFKKAPDEVLAGRRILRVKRKEPSTAAPSSNPFAGIRLVPPSEPKGATIETNATLADQKPSSAEASTDAVVDVKGPASEDAKSDALKEAESVKDEGNVGPDVREVFETKVEKVEAGIEKETKNAEHEDKVQSRTTVDDLPSEPAGGEESSDVKENKDSCNDKKQSEGDKTNGVKDTGSDNLGKDTDGAPLSSFHQHSSTKNAFTGLSGTGFSGSSFSFGSISQEKTTDQPLFSFGLSNNGNSSIFGSANTSIVLKSEGNAIPKLQEVTVETGEENERAAFSADSVLFEFLEGGWKERGKGELRVNVPTSGNGKARLLMRAKGNYRLILNAGLYPKMTLAKMDKKGISFTCVNSIGEGKTDLSTFALKFKDASIVEEFRAAVLEHKDGGDKGAAPLKTPENSPKASAD